MSDLLLKNGRIVDGTGNPWFVGDVGVMDGVMVEVGRLRSEAREMIDVGGQVICSPPSLLSSQNFLAPGIAAAEFRSATSSRRYLRAALPRLLPSRCSRGSAATGRPPST